MTDQNVIELPEVNVYDRDPPPMGEAAALDSYNNERMRDALFRMGASVESDRVIPPASYKPAPAWATGLVEGARDYVKRPGQMMEKNPYPPGSEQADYYDLMKLKNESDWAGETALNAMGTGGIVGVPARAGEVVLAAGAGRAKGGAPKMGSTAQFPQYAEVYPPVGPPVMRWDPKEKKEFLSKQQTPEAEAFMKERTRISADMEKNGFTPYFDPAKRTDVDPKYYPPNIDTLTVVPKKQATIDEHWKYIGSEDARARLRAGYERGTQIPDADRFYFLGQLEEEFIKELGPIAGRKAFQEKIATAMAATTSGANPQANWLLATYGNYLREKGLPYPQAAHEMPVPVGGRRMIGNTDMHKKVFDEGGFSSLGASNPKRHNFSQNYTGNRGAATMDEQMVSGMVPGMTAPNDKFGLYEKVLREEAAKLTPPVDPRKYQEVGWAGFKNMKDPNYTQAEPFIQTVNKSIERTHRLTGMPRDEIVRRGIIKSEIPMYGILGAVGLGAIADQQRDR